MKDKHAIIPIFVPHLGCPNDCIFCNQVKIASANTNIQIEEIVEIIEMHLKTIDAENTEIEVSFFGGTFTGMDLEIQKNFLKIANKYKEANQIDAIRLSTRPDCIDAEILEMLKLYKVDIIELGVQSLDDSVLTSANRGHTSEDVYQAVKLIREYGFTLGLQIMPGLYNSSVESDLNTVDQVIKLSPDFVRVYPTLVVKNTRLEELYKSGLFKPLTLEEAVSICTDIYYKFAEKNIKIIRMGLQPTENIQLGQDIVAGPFHPAFKQLVQSEIYYRAILDILEKYLNINEIEIEISRKILSTVIGQKRKNIERLEQMYKDIRIIFRESEVNGVGLFIKSENKIYKHNITLNI